MMNMHGHILADNAKKHLAVEQPPTTGIWKLLVASVVILAGLIGAIEIFGDENGEFASHHSQRTTVVE